MALKRCPTGGERRMGLADQRRPPGKPLYPINMCVGTSTVRNNAGLNIKVPNNSSDRQCDSTHAFFLLWLSPLSACCFYRVVIVCNRPSIPDSQPVVCGQPHSPEAETRISPMEPELVLVEAGAAGRQPHQGDRDSINCIAPTKNKKTKARGKVERRFRVSRASRGTALHR